MSQSTSPTSPKQPQTERRRDWYPYYAGFTEGFVDYVLSEYAPDASTVVDPWNGSGTTTVACARRGLEGSGIDINPVLTLIARARLTPRSVADSLIPLAARIVSAAEVQSPHLRSPDMLTTWLRPVSAVRVRAIQAAIHSTLSDLPDKPDELAPTVLADRLPLLACFYYAALFAAMRDILRQFRASNPTWVTDPLTYRHRLDPAWTQVTKCFLDRVNYLSRRLTIGVEDSAEPLAEIITASATNLPFRNGSFGAGITSPPYATRIDYVKSVLPELAVLGASQEEVDALRRASTGSPVVRDCPSAETKTYSHTARTLLEEVKAHGSKGSSSYYHPWLRNYLAALQAGLLETARVVKTGGTIAIVVQDSHYKEMPIRLQRIVGEVMRWSGRRLLDQRDFHVKHHRARMNPRALKHLRVRENRETLLVFT